MTLDLLQSMSAVAAALSALTAILSAVCAVFSYRLSRKLWAELKSDERVIAGTPIHPKLKESEHSLAVIQCTLFNKSKRKAYINSVTAYTDSGAKIGVTWSDGIDDLGNINNPCKLIGLVDASSLYIRRNDGEMFSYARLEISHSFSDKPMTVIFSLNFED